MDIMFEANNMANLLHGLECSDCAFTTLGCSHRRKGEYCETNIHDAADLIERMATELEQVKRERDAAVRDLRLHAVNGNTCAFCKNNGGCAERMKHLDSVASCWEWRGLCKGNGGVNNG